MPQPKKKDEPEFTFSDTPVLFDAQGFISKDDFRDGLEYALEEKETNRRQRRRLRRALRNPRVFSRLYDRAAPQIPQFVPNSDGDLVRVDFDNILDWFLENWDEILKILLTILPLFI